MLSVQITDVHVQLLRMLTVCVCVCFLTPPLTDVESGSFQWCFGGFISVSQSAFTAPREHHVRPVASGELALRSARRSVPIGPFVFVAVETLYNL